MYTISKSFEFDYGHRVWNQILQSEFSIDNRCVCRHLHGHRGRITLSFSSDFLTDGMVTDFKHLNWFKQFLDSHLDHKMILDIADPILNNLVPAELLTNKERVFIEKTSSSYYKITPHLFEDLSQYEKDFYEGLIFVPFVPTAENFSAWIFEIVYEKMKSIATLESVDFKETPNSSSTFKK